MWSELQNGFEWLPEPVYKKWFARIIRTFQRYWFNSSMSYVTTATGLHPKRACHWGRTGGGTCCPTLQCEFSLSTARPDFTYEQRTEQPPDPFNTLNQTVPSILSDNFRRTYFCWKSLRTVLRRAGLFYKDAIGHLPSRCLHSSRCVSSRYVISFTMNIL